MVDGYNVETAYGIVHSVFGSPFSVFGSPFVDLDFEPNQPKTQASSALE